MADADTTEHAASGLTLVQYATAKQLPVDELRRYGLSDFHYQGAPTVRVPYPGLDGSGSAVRFRIALVGDKFRWKSGSKLSLYGLWLLNQHRKHGHVVLVEGESDCHTLWHYGIPALGIPGAENWKEERDAVHLEGFETIFVVIEPDQGGDAVLDWLSTSRIRERVRLVRLGEFKDPSGLHCADPDHFLERLGLALTEAEPWTDVHRAEADRAAEEAYALARGLLHDPHLLDRVGQAMAARGYAGDLRPPTLAYVGLTSRFLERPQNLAVVSPSAAGKNRTVDAATDLLPPDAVHLVTAGSARAVIYDDADYQNKVVIFAEADSIPDDGPAASAVRSLAESNELAYDVVERDETTNRFTTRHIRKPGPTGLITTSTKSLAYQLGTRVLEITLADDAEQTRAVMRAHARKARRGEEEPSDVAIFHAMQRWLELAGVREVDVPFAEHLAELVPATAVRMRRDFRQLLTCIQAITLLYQCQRQQRDGWVIATLADYAQAYALLAPVFAAVAAEGLTPAVRATVEAVAPSDEVSESDLAQRLNLSKSTVHYRVSRAIRGGWLVNREQRKGHPAKLARGVPLPDAVSALPTPAELTEVFECSNDFRERDTPPPPHTDRIKAGDGGEGVWISPESFEHSNTFSEDVLALADRLHYMEVGIGRETIGPGVGRWQAWLAAARNGQVERALDVLTTIARAHGVTHDNDV